MIKCPLLYLVLIFIFVLNLSKVNASVDFQINLPDSVAAGDTFIVVVNVNKSNISGFAKFETELPIGFLVEGRQCSKATFIYKDNKAKFIWLGLPDENEFIVSFKVTVSDQYNGKLNLPSHFFYVKNKDKKSIDKSASIYVINDNVEVVDVDYSKYYEDQEKIKKRILFDLNFQMKKDLVYRVQLAAFKNKNVPEEFLNELCENEFRLKCDTVNGLYKYYVGNFYSYQVAEMYRKYSGVKDAFVIPYYKNKKITIKEARKLKKQN